MPSPETTLHRLPERGSYDREQLNRILDEGFLCHVAFCMQDMPFVIPTSYVRIGERLLVHGSAASRMLRTMDAGVKVCVAVTLMDGLVLARSAFHHSMNYRSAVIFGTATSIEDREEKLEALRVLSEHIVPGRWDEVRRPTDKELKATRMLSVPLDNFSVKIRTGGPKDEKEDMDFPVWAGVLQFAPQYGPAIRDANQTLDIQVPQYVRGYSRKRNGSV